MKIAQRPYTPAFQGTKVPKNKATVGGGKNSESLTAEGTSATNNALSSKPKRKKSTPKTSSTKKTLSKIAKWCKKQKTTLAAIGASALTLLGNNIYQLAKNCHINIKPKVESGITIPLTKMVENATLKFKDEFFHSPRPFDSLVLSDKTTLVLKGDDFVDNVSKSRFEDSYHVSFDGILVDKATQKPIQLEDDKSRAYWGVSASKYKDNKDFSKQFEAQSKYNTYFTDDDDNNWIEISLPLSSERKKDLFNGAKMYKDGKEVQKQQHTLNAWKTE